MKENQDYKNEGLAALKGHWAQAVLAVLLVTVILCVCMFPYIKESMSFSMNAASADIAESMKPLFCALLIYYGGFFLIGGPLLIGLLNAFRRLFSGEGNIVSNTFGIGFGNWAHHVWGYFLRALFTVLWSLLFIIPGIIKFFSYAMTDYILVDYPELSANKAIDLSRAMMRGRKFDLFYLYLSFIGWYILAIFTLGIGFLWLGPYMDASVAAFYNDLKAQQGEAAVTE